MADSTDAPVLWTPPSRNGLKAATSVEDPAGALANSVQSAPTSNVPLGSQWIFSLVHQADGFTAWGSNPKIRDRQLREFIPTEAGLVSALSTVCARNAALSSKLTGDDKTIEAAHEMMNNANFGGGWEQLMIQTSQDLYSQDQGAFIEFIREVPERPDSPVVGLAHLDAGRCYQTGNPEYPVFYEDINGSMHRMPWWNVVHLLEMPAAIVPGFGGPFYRLQYCAVTRALKQAQVLRSIWQYKDEKVSGRFLRALHLISGVSETVVQDAIARAQLSADAAGLTRYIQPAMVGSVDANTPIKHEEIALSSLPEGWDEGESVRVYILMLAMAFLTDYQEFAPLPGGGLGTGAQSQVLHQKSKGKGSGLFQKMIARMMNGGALPSNVLFEWDEPDIEALAAQDDARLTRAQQRQIQITSGEIDAEAARQLAFEAGDISQAIFDDLAARDAQRAADEAARAEAQRAAVAQQQADGVIPSNGTDPQGTGVIPSNGPDPKGAAATGAISSDANRAQGVRSFTGVDADYDPEEFGILDEVKAAAEGVSFGTLLSSRMHRAYSDVADDTHAMGYFNDTAQRVEVASAVGEPLRILEDSLREAGIYDIQISPEDADRIAAASMHLMGQKVMDDLPSPVDGDRLAYEAEVGDQIAQGLGRARRIVRERILAMEAP